MPNPPRNPGCPPRLLTIAGSDSGGGAGIQADLKTFMAFEGYGMSVLTAATAQNTLGVQEVAPLSPAFVSSQLDSVLSDIGVDALKTGMLASASHITALVSSLQQHFPLRSDCPPLVVDPVCASTSGHQLLPNEAISTLREELLPWAQVLTPNVPEAELLLGWEKGKIESVDQMREAAKALGELGPEWVLLKGGHLPFEKDGGKVVVDLLWETASGKEYVTERKWIDSQNTHGTGCTLSAAITALLSTGLSVPLSVSRAGDYVAQAISSSYAVGSGSGPVNHAYNLCSRTLPLPTPLNPTPFTDYLINYDRPTWDLYVNHPFTNGMARGDLPKEGFLHFISQDYHFLKNYARTHSLNAYKSLTLEDMESSQTIVASVIRETGNHIAFCETLGISKEQLLALPDSLAGSAYSYYVLDTTHRGDILDGRVVTAPCLIGYGHMGARLASEPSTAEGGWVDRSEANKMYIKWVDEYAGEWFQGVVQVGIDLLEKTLVDSPISPARLRELAEIFVNATKLEIAFWDEACVAAGVPTAREQKALDDEAKPTSK